MSGGWFSGLTDDIQVRAGKYLINRFVGSYFEGNGILEAQLQAMHIEGTENEAAMYGVSLSDVALNIKVINELLEEHDLPFELVDGFIGEFSCNIPYRLFSKPTHFSLEGLTLTLQVRQRKAPATAASATSSLFYSMYESFSSEHVAEEVIEDVCKNKGTEDDIFVKPGEEAGSVPDSHDSLAKEEMTNGVKYLASAIDSIFNKVQIRLKNTVIRIEYLPTVEPRGLALEIKVGLLMYQGEQASSTASPDRLSQGSSKKIFFENVSFSSDIFEFDHKETASPILTPSERGGTPDSSHNTSRDSEDGKSNFAKEEVKRQNKERKRSSSSCDGKEEEKVEDEVHPPLKFLQIIGRNELIVRFSEYSDAGVPKVVEAININLGAVAAHIYPHQIHSLVEIISALTAKEPAKVMNQFSIDADNPKAVRFSQNVEKYLMQQSMMAGDGSMAASNLAGLGGGEGWSGNSDSMMSSTEFAPCSSSNRKSAHAAAAAAAAVVPCIALKVSSVALVLLEKDESVAKLGGESTRFLAVQAMTSAAFNYFSGNYIVPKHELDIGCERLHSEILKNCHHSNIAVVGLPVTIRYEEGVAMRTTRRSDYNMLLQIDVNKLSAKEVMYNDPLTEDLTDSVDLLSFPKVPRGPDDYSLPPSDFNLTFREYKQKKVRGASEIPMVSSGLDIKLNPCVVDIDPGFVDRTWLMFHYAELDPTCLVTPEAPKELVEPTSLVISIVIPNLTANFRIPKVDMRIPKQIPKFVNAFWSRKIHPELIKLELRNFLLEVHTLQPVEQDPLEVRLRSDFVELSFQENEEAESQPLVQIRQEKKDGDIETKPAAYISVTVCLDDDKKTQGRYSSDNSRSRRRASQKSAKPRIEDSFVTGTYKVSDSGEVIGTNDLQSNIFKKQQEFISEALKVGVTRNNILVDLRFDDISLILPSKRSYEIIYNRLGNDMLLWLPEIFKVKEYLYDEPLPDPLQDPDFGFTPCFSGTKPPEALKWVEDQPRKQKPNEPYRSFPREDSAKLVIHIDTCVLLSIRKAQAVITSPAPSSAASDDNQETKDPRNMILLAVIDRLKLTSITGLERDPEIVIFNLSLGDGSIKFGTIRPPQDLRQLHFNPDPAPESTEILVNRTPYTHRAWPPASSPGGSTSGPTRLMKLTAKILFNTRANMKRINLGFDFSEVSVIFKTLAATPPWVDWLGEFFTVVEYPVEGYLPPAILTEMQFDISRSTLELIPATHPARVALALGQARVACNLLDTGKDVNIGVNLEDIGLYLSRDTVDPIDNSVCVADLDYLDLEVRLTEEQKELEIEEQRLTAFVPKLDVTASCNVVRIRTCADTILIAADLAESMVKDLKESDADQGDSVDQEFDEAMEAHERSGSPTVAPVIEDIVPEMADAMEELIQEGKLAEEMEAKAREEDKRRSQEAGNVYFYFEKDKSGEGKVRANIPENVCMTESFYDRQQSLDDSFDEFCVLDHELGAGVVESSQAGSVRISEDIAIGEDLFMYRQDKPKATNDGMPDEYPDFQTRFTLKRMSVRWKIFGGNDFSHNKGMQYDTRNEVIRSLALSERAKAARETMDARPASAAAMAREQEASLKNRGGAGRDLDRCIEVVLNKIHLLHESYDDGCPEVSRQVLIVSTLEIMDYVRDSEMHKVLHHHTNSNTRPRQTNSHMFSFRSFQVQPELEDSVIETSIHLSALPLRVNLDQDTLFFIIDFAKTLNAGEETKKNAVLGQISSASTRREVPLINAGLLVDEIRTPDFDDEEGVRFSTPERQFSDGSRSTSERSSRETTPEASQPSLTPKNSSSRISKKPELGMFIRAFIFGPTLLIRVDYYSKYIDCTQGALAGFLTGVASLENSEITLKAISYRDGILGLEKLVQRIVQEWGTDITKNQIPRLLGGVGPMYSILQLFQGVKDLVIMPYEQYQKDGRILRGFQKGANSFTSSTAMSVLDFSNKVIIGIKFLAEVAFFFMSPEGTIIQGKLPFDGANPGGEYVARRRRRLAKPVDLREGVMNAIEAVRDEFGETARAISDAAMFEHRRRGLPAAVGSVIRNIPPTCIRPVIALTGATSSVLEGVQSQVAPELRKEEEEKWRRNPPQP